MFTPEEIKEGTFLLFNKPLGLTSHDVVHRVRRVLVAYSGEKNLKVGHAGTLDPLATGLLILATGKFTKRIDEIQVTDKEYTGTFYLGATTASYDLEKKPEHFTSIQHITTEIILAATKNLRGEIQQVPPIHSAIKKDGQRAFQKARAGKEIVLDARKVFIHAFEITNIRLPEVDFKVNCSKGTYIRSLANDFGTTLGCGAYLSSLCRTKIGNHSLQDAFELPDFLNTYNQKTEQKN
ncbi:MAG: tRNA pseudouridine(55) synthase TruB [Chitinophagales bacterium]